MEQPTLTVAPGTAVSMFVLGVFLAIREGWLEALLLDILPAILMRALAQIGDRMAGWINRH